MMRMTFLVLALASSATALPFAPARAQIIGHAPWCAVSDTGAGRIESDCEYYSIEECRPNLIGGNRGICLPNPHAIDQPAPVRRHKIRHKPRVNGD